MIFIGLLRTGAVEEKVQIVEHLIACAFLPLLHPLLFIPPKNLNSKYQALPDLISLLGGMIQFII